jgi:threonine aldolase
MKIRADFRSDTVTHPTPAMRRAMANAVVGDDVMGEDPTINRLQERAAELTGKQAALFVPSGTCGNQCAIMTWTRSGDEVLVAERSHVVQHEAGGAAVLARAQVRALSPGSSHLRPEDVAPRLRGVDIHYPRTGLVCLEQAAADGTVVPLATLSAVRKAARGVPVHMDGARLFNAAAALGVPAARACVAADSVTFCLSKGLSAPVGSVLCGPKDFIEEARRVRKLLGGGMRQAGILAAAGLVALEEQRPRLSVDHAKAKLLASLLREIPGVRLLREPQINLVFVSLAAFRFKPQALVDAMAKRGFAIFADENGEWRFATHRQVTLGDCRALAAALAGFLRARSLAYFEARPRSA